tara:strand:- start:24761 stop:25522 length:762 start_codon:yes stop_codon:yes gene_type:complete
MLAERISKLEGNQYEPASSDLGNYLVALVRRAFYKESELLRFWFPTPDKKMLTLKVHNDKPFIFIDGWSGCGKTHICLSYIEQSLSQGRQVSYIGLQGELDNKSSLLSAKITALYATYANQLRLTKSSSITSLMSSMKFARDEVVIIDEPTFACIKGELAEFAALAKVLDLTVILVGQSFHDFAELTNDAMLMGNDIEHMTVDTELYKFIKSNVSVVMSWGKHSIFNKAIPVGQFAVNQLYSGKLGVIYVPEL